MAVGRVLVAAADGDPSTAIMEASAWSIGRAWEAERPLAKVMAGGLREPALTPNPEGVDLVLFLVLEQAVAMEDASE